jgi:hypothetical protein
MHNLESVRALLLSSVNRGYNERYLKSRKTTMISLFKELCQRESSLEGDVSPERSLVEGSILYHKGFSLERLERLPETDNP